MASLFLPLDGERVTLEVGHALTTVARTIFLESSFHRRTGVRVRFPDRWARSIAMRVLADHDDPERWAARQAELARRIEIARRMAPESRDVPLLSLADRLLERRLEDGTRLDDPDVSALARTALYVVGHGRHRSCATCALLRDGDIRGYLRATGCDPVLPRILHSEAQQAELLPPYPLPAAQYEDNGFLDSLTPEELAGLRAEQDAA